VQDGKSSLKRIIAAFQYNGHVKVQEGLDIGDQVIISGQNNLLEGSHVKVIE
jgi:hypothetical protein